MFPKLFIEDKTLFLYPAFIIGSDYWHTGSEQEIECKDDFSTAAVSTATKYNTHLCNIEINDGLTNISVTFR